MRDHSAPQQSSIPAQIISQSPSTPLPPARPSSELLRSSFDLGVYDLPSPPPTPPPSYCSFTLAPATHVNHDATARTNSWSSDSSQVTRHPPVTRIPLVGFFIQYHPPAQGKFGIGDPVDFNCDVHPSSTIVRVLHRHPCCIEVMVRTPPGTFTNHPPPYLNFPFTWPCCLSRRDFDDTTVTWVERLRLACCTGLEHVFRCPGWFHRQSVRLRMLRAS
jgi:hypothetical protein